MIEFRIKIKQCIGLGKIEYIKQYIIDFLHEKNVDKFDVDWNIKELLEDDKEL